MASRRENRMAAAQNDALMEFENFKKKYLLVNKHVTKLNSTLSVRVEELNDQLAMLQLENIRLRSANISLSAQLKRERQLKGRGSDPKTVALIDAATTEALRQLTAIRNALVNGNSGQQSPPTRSIPTPPSTSPAARIVGPVHPGQNTRIPVARAPEFPPLVESSESARSAKSRRRSSGGMTTDEEDAEAEPRITKRTSHGIPTPSYLESESEAELESKGRRRAGRQSALLARNSVVEEDTARDKSPVELTVEVPVKTKFKSTPAVTESKRSKRKLVESEPDDAIKSVGVIVDLPDEEEDFKPQHTRPRAVNKLQDVTNSPRKTVGRAREKGKIVEDDDEEPVMIGAYMGTPAINKTQLPEHDRLYPLWLRPQVVSLQRRERRARKSVNYAEPKLNTKMRKPAPDATSYGRFSLPTSKPRISTSIPRESSPPPESPMPPLLDPETKVDDGVTVRARRRRPTSSVITDDDDGAEGLDADDDLSLVL
ncbi:hypothetical protein RhiXN_01319 [Rhizoctonia solani]|uniref:Shugoshin C-terminal domain-containing protein n=1 Tax=Rhizoctonia solani TaxID=456999 RepID=A0A8H8T2V7_9AGAM|nr:uncharacterized protein RhiXN_01319 [Rhizoctonia solani]QRW26724.1 hypothetical protein RhiXN_01319 [Rhizoctonia solani]